MYLRTLNILNFRNIAEADLCFSDKINCLVGMNGMGKTNVLDAIYYLSFTKSAFQSLDSQNIRHGEDMAMMQGVYEDLPNSPQAETITCGIKRGQKKQIRRGKKDYKRLLDHIGLIPLVMVAPQDTELIIEGSDSRRRFMDAVISQQKKEYLVHLSQYNALLKQRNALLKQQQEQQMFQDSSLFEVLEMQMSQHAQYIHAERTAFISAFIPVFQDIYSFITDNKEEVSLQYISQLNSRDLYKAYADTRARDLILGWTTQGTHKDELEMKLGNFALKQVGSQGQQKTYLIAMKMAQAIYLAQNSQPPILLLDDIFDKLDAERVSRIVELVSSERFGQIFITDTDRQHLVDILRPQTTSRIYAVENGIIKPISNE